MSYFTRVEFLFEGEAPAFESVAECVRANFDTEHFDVEDMISELRSGWEKGSAELNHLESCDIITLMCCISHYFPSLRMCVRGRGGEWRDLWIREFAEGKVTFSAGPFVEGEKASFLKHYFL